MLPFLNVLKVLFHTVVNIFKLLNFQEHSSLAPSQVLNVLSKGLKKLGADSFSSQESVDDGAKKVISLNISIIFYIIYIMSFHRTNKVSKQVSISALETLII